MKLFFSVYLILSVIISIPLFVMIIKRSGFYNKFAIVLSISNHVVMFFMLVGLIDGRIDMYIDVAISFAVLSFISAVIVARFMTGKGGRND